MSTQFSSFKIDGRLYGINVKLVQEITMAMPVTKVPLAPKYIHGLINLRGQIATAVGLRELFELPSESEKKEVVNVVCKSEGLLLSLVVDEIGDVLEVDENQFETTPDTISGGVAQFMSGVYKLPTTLLSVIDARKIVEFLNR